VGDRPNFRRVRPEFAERLPGARVEAEGVPRATATAVPSGANDTEVMAAAGRRQSRLPVATSQAAAPPGRSFAPNPATSVRPSGENATARIAGGLANGAGGSSAAGAGAASKVAANTTIRARRIAAPPVAHLPAGSRRNSHTYPCDMYPDW